MQYLIIVLALLFTSVIVAQSVEESTLKEKSTIKVSVVNALNDKGTISFAFYNETGFLKQSLISKSAIITNGISTVEFESIYKGTYAVVCFHDENRNGKLDFELNGMPKEAFGASNNIMNFGPPQFEDSKFEVLNDDITLEIKF